MTPGELLARALAKKNTTPASPAPATTAVAESDNPQLSNLIQTINELREQLLAEHPQLELYTQLIHKQMVEFPELCHLLSDEDIAVVYRAALRQSDTVLVKTKATKEKAAAKANLALGQDW